MLTNNTELQSHRKKLETLGEFDIGPVADIAFRVGQIIGPTHNAILNTFLTSDKVYEPDATRKKLIDIIDSCLAAETN